MCLRWSVHEGKSNDGICESLQLNIKPKTREKFRNIEGSTIFSRIFMENRGEVTDSYI